MEEDFYWSIFNFSVGIFGIWMFFYTTRQRFFHSKTFSRLKYITPLPISFNFWLIKILYFVGGLLCVVVGIYGMARPFL
ncbi:hypothetical protein V2J23_11440 [Geobacillus thermoleovorans]|uniref:Uncharacterized protein n=6 Tax=Anoxybacillaceae TaxID=3120669 RepID=A0A7W8IPW3_9BACL|nr:MULTISPECIES: hypothetical protein [Bacillaceae]MCG6173936.1 hypothetical protein [Anoxybacillus sp. LAT_31]MCG6176741.1 hypothetical protein [Anoxybacillus sp. LAT_35]OXB91413.1 hypothetical protein B9L21_00810 [Geobacillus uzenensis]QAV27467.1 hypothetical protein BTDUT50_12965 [Neobacillus thermocopriae]AOL35708.1 hypothetical protein BGM21_15100 [Geobacillus thermoleovorans]